MKYATFVNFTEKPFTAYWNGKPYTFNPGQKKEHLNAAIAQHFAKHLANQVLTTAGKETSTSPKKPDQVPEFMEVFNKACFLEDDGAEVDSETGLPVDGPSSETGAGLPDQEPSMNIEVKPRSEVDPYDANATPQTGPGGKAQVIGNATENEDATDEEFEDANNK